MYIYQLTFLRLAKVSKTDGDTSKEMECIGWQAAPHCILLCQNFRENRENFREKYGKDKGKNAIYIVQVQVYSMVWDWITGWGVRYGPPGANNIKYKKNTEMIKYKTNIRVHHIAFCQSC